MTLDYQKEGLNEVFKFINQKKNHVDVVFH